MKISLNNNENKIINLLMNVVRTKATNTVLRIAGGWTRDKLLGLDSNDIDIAVSNMTGEAFATLVQEYMSENSMKKQNITVIEANPDQSKHLATAMIRLFGLPIDFVNLRTETYATSRIPTMEIGTAEEDAKRRDLTINSLFYNINSREIEDYVGGIQDLHAGIARTPLDPVQTFLDDPLRILRTIRFAAKYGLKLDISLVEAANKPEVKEAFKTKISNERIWAELAGKKDGDKYKAGALIGPNPARAIELLMELGLMEIIFDPTPEEIISLAPLSKDPSIPPTEWKMVPWNTNQNNPHHQFDIWNHTISVTRNLIGITSKQIDYEMFLIRNISALLHDIGKRYTGIQGIHATKGHTNYHGHEEVSGKIAEMVLTRLHAPVEVIKRVVDLISIHLRPHILLENGNGKSYRRFARDHQDWMHSIDLAIADDLGKQSFSDEEIVQEKKKYEDLRDKIHKAMQWAGKPTNSKVAIPRPINGNDLLAMGIKQGPIFGQIMTAIDEALLENPEMTKEEAINIASSLVPG